MGVSFGRTDLLVYVLVPLCTRRCIRSSLGRNDVCLTLEQLSISGVYFGRKSGKNGYDDDLSVTSFSSVYGSMQGDFVEKQDRQILLSSKGPTDVKKHVHYNGTDKLQNQELLDHPELHVHAVQSMSQSGSPQGKSKDLKVVQTRMSHTDAVPPASTEGQPIRVVRPKIMYIDHSMDIQDSPMIGRAAFDGEHHDNIVSESTDNVQESPQNYMYMYKEGVQYETSNGHQNLWHEKKERIPVGEQEALIVPRVKHRRDEDRELTDELMEEHINHGMDWVYNSMPNNLNDRTWTDREERENDKRQMSVMDFSVEDNKYDSDKGGQPQSSVQTSAIGTAEAEVTEGYPSTKRNLIPVERSTSKSDGKRRYTSTATFKVNMGNKSANFKEQPMRFVNDEICKPGAMDSLNMSQPGFDTKERSQSPSRQAEDDHAAWYEDAAAEDYYKAMIPEPEPGNTQHLYQHEDFHRHKMVPEEETATPRNDSATCRNMHSGVRTPLYTPPSSFRDPTPAGSRLVMVKTGLVDTPKQQPFILSMDHHSMPQHGWESPRMEPNKLRQFPKTVAMPSDSFENKSADFNFDEHGRRNPDRPDRFVNGYQQQHLADTKSESEVLSDYDDSVFTDHDDTGRRFPEVPPPYVAPPDYKKTGKRSGGKFSDDSISTGDFQGSYFCY